MQVRRFALAVLRDCLRQWRFSSSMCPENVPLVVVLGSTGAGKSQLAIELAEKFSGEIISADSMQVYKGLDIVTNKVTQEEMGRVPHHVIDFVDPRDNYTVVEFRNECLRVIKDLHRRKKLPVVVGGTNYYIESILWKVLISEELRERRHLSSESSDSEGSGDETPQEMVPVGGKRRKCEPVDSVADSAGKPNQDRSGVNLASEAAVEVSRTWVDPDNLEGMSTEKLYSLLKEVDPDQADVLHPNERRKALRALEVYFRSGERLSELLRRQRAQSGGSEYGGPLRFARVCLLWVTSEAAALDRRLDRRVDQMLSLGLLRELGDFHRAYNAERVAKSEAPDYTRGIFQSIGFKEFHEYLTTPESPGEDGTADRERLLAESVERMKLVTRRYARKQTRWVQRRFLRQGGDRRVPPVYRFDSTDPEKWDQLVRRPAEQVVEAFLAGRQPAQEPEPLEPGPGNDKTTYHCDICGVFMSGITQKEAHFKSRRHKKTLQNRTKRSKQEMKRKESSEEADEKVGGDCKDISCCDTVAVRSEVGVSEAVGCEK